MARCQKKKRKRTLDVGDLRQWCAENSLSTDPAEAAAFDEHRVLVSAYEVSPRKVYIMLTTKHLSSVCAHAQILQTDATHKVNWHGYPLIVVGHQDKNRHVHPTSLHVVWRSENHLVYKKVSLICQNNHAFLNLAVNQCKLSLLL